MCSRWRRATASAGLALIFAASAGGAQPARASEEAAAGRERSPEELAERAARRAAAERRIAETLERLSVRAVEAAVVAADARRLAAGLSERQLEALLEGEELRSVLLAAAVEAEAVSGGERVSAATVGDAESELLFVPLAPCRVIDTRLGGGPMAPSELRSFEVAGNQNFAAQGGNASGCGIPLGSADPLAPAVVINFIAVSPTGSGHLLAWEFGQPAPNASIINYADVPGLNIANGVVVPISGVSTTAKDLSIVAAVSQTHVVADVTGYFTRFPVEQFQSGLKSAVAATANTTLVDLADGGCKEINSCSLTASAAGTVVVEAWAQVVVNHTSGTTDRFVMQVETAGSVSCPEDDTVNASDYEIPATLGSNIDVDFTLSHARTFPISAGQNRTFRLSGRMVSGAGTSDQVENSRMLCTFIPD